MQKQGGESRKHTVTVMQSSEKRQLKKEAEQSRKQAARAGKQGASSEAEGKRRQHPKEEGKLQEQASGSFYQSAERFWPCGTRPAAHTAKRCFLNWLETSSKSSFSLPSCTAFVLIWCFLSQNGAPSRRKICAHLVLFWWRSPYVPVLLF